MPHDVIFSAETSIRLKGVVSDEQYALVKSSDELADFRLGIDIDVMAIPDGVRTHPKVNTIIRLLGLKPADIKDAPIDVRHYVRFGSRYEDGEWLKRQVWLNTRTALAGVAQRRFEQLWGRELESAKAFCRKYYFKRVDWIMMQLGLENSRIKKMAEICVDSPGKHNSVYDIKKYYLAFTYCSPNLNLTTKPPVKITLIPENSADISLLTGISEEQLPVLCQLVGKIPLGKGSEDIDPLTMVCQDANYKRERYQKAFQFVLCMTKREFKVRIIKMD